MKHFVLMCLLLFIHTSQSQIYNKSYTEGADVSLYCKHKGKVQWSKDRDRNRKDILTTGRKEKIKKLCADPHNRYSVLGDLSLHIKNLSVSDSGIYYCNKNPTVNLTVTASETTSVSETSNTNHTDQPKSTRATPTSDNISVTTFSSQLNVSSTTDVSTTSTRSSTKTKRAKKTKHVSTTSTRSSTETERAKKTKYSIKIALALSGGVVFVVLVLLLWAWIKRKATLNKKENIYETVDDSSLTAQPVPLQKPNDAIYYLAGDPDIVKLGQIKETDDHTYTLISQSKENITEQEEGVPLYSTIKVDTINQP